jgi:hypothetical protein
MKELVKVQNREGVRQSDVWDNIMNAFKDLLDSPNEKCSEDVVLEFRNLMCEVAVSDDYLHWKICGAHRVDSPLPNNFSPYTVHEKRI